MLPAFHTLNTCIDQDTEGTYISTPIWRVKRLTFWRPIWVYHKIIDLFVGTGDAMPDTKHVHVESNLNLNIKKIWKQKDIIYLYQMLTKVIDWGAQNVLNFSSKFIKHLQPIFFVSKYLGHSSDNFTANQFVCMFVRGAGVCSVKKS